MEVDAFKEEVQWGQVECLNGEGEGKGVGHCSFSAGDVRMVQPGKRYA
jgi:hypothetical protein